MTCFVEMINRREAFPTDVRQQLAEPALIDAVAGQESSAACPLDDTQACGVQPG